MHVTLFDFGFIKLKNIFFKTIGKNIFSEKRELPAFKSSFRKTSKKL